MILSYIRVSTKRQSTTSQKNAIKKATGNKRIHWYRDVVEELPGMNKTKLLQTLKAYQPDKVDKANKFKTHTKPQLIRLILNRALT